MLQEAGFAAAAVTSFLAIGRHISARRYTITTIALGVGSLAAIAGSSYVGISPDRPFALLRLVVHLSFAGASASAVLLLLLFLILERAGGVRFAARPLLRSFGASACCVAFAFVTGIALAARQVASLDALLTTTYGQILIVKVSAVGIAGLLGLRTTVRLRCSGQKRTASVSRGVALESAALLQALAAAGALSVGTPARGPAFTPFVAGGPSVVSPQVNDLLESAALAPDAVGRSWLRLDVNQTRRPVPAPVTGVTATLLGPDSRGSTTGSLTRTEIANRWDLGGVNLTAAGIWQLAMTVQRVGRPSPVWRASWIVAGNPADARKALISDRPWESTLNDCAVLIAMLTLGVGFSAVWINGRRRRRFTHESEQARQSQKRTPVGL
jgi:copper transport protein